MFLQEGPQGRTGGLGSLRVQQLGLWAGLLPKEPCSTLTQNTLNPGLVEAGWDQSRPQQEMGMPGHATSTEEKSEVQWLCPAEAG